MEKQELLNRLKEILVTNPEFKQELLSAVNSMTEKDIEKDVEIWAQKEKLTKSDFVNDNEGSDIDSWIKRTT